MSTYAPGPLLVIEADQTACGRLAGWLRQDGFEVVAAVSADEGYRLACELRPALILSEFSLAMANDSHLLRSLLQALPASSVIVLTEDAALDAAVRALQQGASDFLVKSLLNEDVLRVSVRAALERFQLREENHRYREQLERANQQLQHSLQLLEHDQRAGRQVQRRLLPPTPHLSNGLTLSHMIQPSLFLSGDFVDYFSVGVGRTAFYLADVSGHGASSAFVTVFLKTLTNRIRRHYEKRASMLSLSPARIMAAMNEELRVLDTGKHLTLFCGVIDTNRQVLTYALGGHHPPPLLWQEGVTTPLRGQGLPLGLFPDARYEEHEVALAQRFSLLACSDGILEVIPAGDLVAKETWLQSEVTAANGQMDTLTERLALASLADVPDDIALLMIRRDE